MKSKEYPGMEFKFVRSVAVTAWFWRFVYLSFNNFVTLPALGKFVNLSKISLIHCMRLREIPELPPNLVEVDAWECDSLERYSKLPKYSLNTVKMNLGNCYTFSECLEDDMKMLENILLTNQVYSHRFSVCLGNDMKMMENIFLNNQDSLFCLVFPGSEVPKWFDYCSKEVITTENGCSTSSTCAVSFEIPRKLELENIAGVAAICSCSNRFGYLRADLSINGVHIHQHIYEVCPFLSSDHMWLGYIPLSGEIKGNLLGQWPYKCRVEIEGESKGKYGLKSCGVHLVCQSPNENSNKMVMADEPASDSGMHTERKRPHTGANDDYHHQLEQQSSDYSASASTRSNLPEENVDLLPQLQLTLATPGFQ